MSIGIKLFKQHTKVDQSIHLTTYCKYTTIIIDTGDWYKLIINIILIMICTQTVAYNIIYPFLIQTVHL